MGSWPWSLGRSSLLSSPLTQEKAKELAEKQAHL